MRQRAVLKAERPPQSRVLLRAAAQDDLPTTAEPGVWLSQSDLDAMRDQCFEQGRAQGNEEGRQQSLQEFRARAEQEARTHFEREFRSRQDSLAREQAEKWRGLAQALAVQTQALRDRLEVELTEWVFIATTRLLGRRFPRDVADAVRQVLTEAQLDGPLTVMLHARDLAAVEGCRAAGVEAWPAGLRFMADDRVQLGGCLVQSPVQTLDARLEVQLCMLRERLDAARAQRIEGGPAA